MRLIVRTLSAHHEQVRAMRQYEGCCRFFYHKALAWQNEQYAADKSVKLSYTTLVKTTR